MNKKLVIFGAGEWGRMAYYYYKDKCEIECFLDNSMEIWGEKINGIEICSPEKIKEMNLRQIRIVIANKRRSSQILKQLNEQFGVSQCIVFKLETEVEEYVIPCEDSDIKQECIVEYRGGLGNQMFQYALAKCLMIKGACTTSDLSQYYKIEEREFVLQEVFPHVTIKKGNVELKKIYKADEALYIREQSILSVDKKEADLDVLNIEQGYFEGCWQTCRYAELVEKELRKDFEFVYENDRQLSELAENINRMEHAVSVHIRRGDYLERTTQRHFGDICTEDYYKKAIAYIEKHVETPFFLFFSNDIKWVKENYGRNDAAYISEDMFGEYKDWYDMFLMSCCKHNIIANSTFSWWGAWLNCNKSKIVIAPSKWVNNCEIVDMCPKEWIRL